MKITKTMKNHENPYKHQEKTIKITKINKTMKLMKNHQKNTPVPMLTAPA